MSALGALNPTLLDLSKQMDPNGTVATVVEILNQTNEVLTDMTWQEGNLPTGNRTTIRAGIPAPTWRKMYGFTAPNKSTYVQVTDNCGMLEAYAEVDKALVELAGNPSAFRLNEDKAHIEGMAQTVATTLFYGNEGTTPEAFTGLTPRYNLTTAEVGDNIIKAGGSDTDNQSIWLVVWGDKIHGIVPKNSKAGIQVEDKGVQTVMDATGIGAGRMEAYVTHYRWDVGLTVRDWRYAVRICNIDKSLLSRVYTSGNFSTGPHLPDLMFQAMRRLPNMATGKPVFYASREICTWIARQTSAATQGSTLTYENVGGGQPWTERFMGIPLRRVDALSADEALVS